MNMNKVVIFISIFTVIFCISCFTYLNHIQQKKALQIESDNYERFQLWTKSYDTIKQELESKKQVKNFLEQEEYTRQLEDFIKAQLGNFTQEQQGFRQEFSSLLKQQKDAYDKSSIDFGNQINEQKQRFLEYEVKTDKILEENFLGIRQELTKLQKEAEENRNQLKGYNKRLEESEKKAQEYNKLIQDYRQQQLEYERKLSAYANLTQNANQ